MSHFAAMVLAATMAMTCASQEATVEPATTQQKFTIESAGKDVRDLMHKLFTEAKRNYIMDPAIRHELYLNVANLDFDTAFRLLCEQADLTYELQNEIYYIGRAPAVVASSGRKGSDFDWEAILARPVTLKKERIAIRSAFAELGKQGRIQIKVDQSVPDYLVNVSFTNVSLRYALDNLTKAAKLGYDIGLDGTVRVGLQQALAAPAALGVSETSHGSNVAPALKCPNCGTGLNKGWKYCPACGYWVKPVTGG
jgi:hypothetical protein